MAGGDFGREGLLHEQRDPHSSINLEDAAYNGGDFVKPEQVFPFLRFHSLCRKHSTIVSQQFIFPLYDSCDPVMVLRYLFILAMFADCIEAGACCPGHTIELSTY